MSEQQPTISESSSTMDSIKSAFSKYKFIIVFAVVAVIVIALWWFKPMESFRVKDEVDKLIDKIHRKQGILQKSK